MVDRMNAPEDTASFLRLATPQNTGTPTLNTSKDTNEPLTTFIPFDQTAPTAPQDATSGKGALASQPSFGVGAYKYNVGPITYLEEAEKMGQKRIAIRNNALNEHAVTYGFNSWNDWVQNWKQNPDNMFALTDALENQLGANYKPFREALDWYEKNGLTLAEMPQLNKDNMMNTLIQTLAATVGDAAVGLVGGDVAAMARTTPSVVSQISQDASNMLMTEIQKNEDMKHKTELLNLEILSKYKGNLASMKAAVDADMNQGQKEYMRRRTEYIFNRQEAFIKNIAGNADVLNNIQDDIAKELILNKNIEEKNISNRMQRDRDYSQQRQSASIHNQQMAYQMYSVQQQAMAKMFGRKSANDDKMMVALSGLGVIEAHNMNSTTVAKNAKYSNQISYDRVLLMKEGLRAAITNLGLKGAQIPAFLNNYSALLSTGNVVNIKNPEAIALLAKTGTLTGGITRTDYMGEQYSEGINAPEELKKHFVNINPADVPVSALAINSFLEELAANAQANPTETKQAQSTLQDKVRVSGSSE